MRRTVVCAWVLVVFGILPGMSLLSAALQTAQGKPAPQQKVIHDPVEYNAYITALNTQDPLQKAAAMEAFVLQYPESVVKMDALEQAMAAYQQSGNQAKVEETARQILQLSPDHIRALAVLAFIDRANATNGIPETREWVKLACDESQHGLDALSSMERPEGLTDADFEKLRNQMADIFEGAAGFCALQSKNYTLAKQHLGKAVQIDPTNLGDTYQLAVAELSSTPPDVNGFWHCARAVRMAQSQKNGPAAQSMENYCRSSYRKYHGSEEGWEQFVQKYGNETKQPVIEQAAVKRPTPCEIAVYAVQQNDISQLSFSDQEFVLSQKGCSPAGTEAADKVWLSIQNLQKGGQEKLEFAVKVISATKETIEAAITDKNQQTNQADVHVILETPVVTPPPAGTMLVVIGVFTSYKPNPFMFTVERGEIETRTSARTANRDRSKTGGNFVKTSGDFAGVRVRNKAPDVSASAFSLDSPGMAQSVPAGISSQNRTPASIMTSTGASASVLSSGSPGIAHNVPASVLSFNSIGNGHLIRASITSSAAPVPAVASPARGRTVRFGHPHRPPQGLTPIPIFLPTAQNQHP